MFSLTLAKDQLLPALLTVAGAVDKKPSPSILANILLCLDANKLQLIATDLELEITALIHCNSETLLKTTNTAGQITVPAKKFIDIIRSLDDETLSLVSENNNSAIINAGRGQFKLATLPPQDFPASTKEASKIEFTITKEAITRLLQSTSFAMANQEVRIFMNGLLLELDMQKITTVAMDGHRMAICNLPCAAINSYHRFVLPKRCVHEMLRLLGNSGADEEMHITAGTGFLTLHTQHYTLQSRLIATRFPSYAKAIPRNQDKIILVAREPLKRALSRIMILAHEKLRAITLHMQPGMLTIIAHNQTQEEAIENLEAETSGEEIKIGLNATYLLDVLNCFSDGLVRISLSSPDSSMLITSLQDEHYQYILMPMKL